jgi:hypothetical protein
VVSFLLVRNARGLQSPTTRPSEATSAASQPTTEPAGEPPPAKRSYRSTNALSARRAAEPVDYARPLDQFDIPNAENFKWLIFGLEHRTRFEIRDDNYRQDLAHDSLFLLRSRAFVGIQEIIDPLRFGVEFQDAREFSSIFPENTSNVDEYDLLQGYGELFFRDLFGKDEPLRLQAGRMSLDYVDRRLRTRNGFRNTTNTFDGFRLVLGQQNADWELDLSAVQPVVIRPEQFNKPDEQRWLYSMAGYWRRWSQIITLEPYYFVLDEQRVGWRARNVQLHTPGIHAFGPIGETGLDWDVDFAYQFGRNQYENQRAFATHGELGYNFKHPLEPRVAAWINFATGDRSPEDAVNNQFDSLFGSNTAFYGWNEFFTWENMINPVLECRVVGSGNTRLSAYYRTFWLASDRDS